MEKNTNLIQIFEYALNQEKTGMSFFQSSLERMGVGAAVSAFQKLIGEEQKHIDFISGIIRDLKSGNEVALGDMVSATIEPTNYFDERSKKEFLEQCVQGSMVPDVTIFNTAWLIEKDLSDFYARMSEKTTGKVSKALGMLSAWEKEHEKFFKEYRDKLSEVYAQMPWGG